MANRGLWLAGTILSGVVMAVGVIYTILNVDTEGPIIYLPETEISYQEGEPTESLLTGVTAIDQRDGDVSWSIVVESIIPLESEKSARIVYAAKDSSNNITTSFRMITYEAKAKNGTEAGFELTAGASAAIKEEDMQKRNEVPISDTHRVSQNQVSQNEVSQNEAPQNEEPQNETAQVSSNQTVEAEENPQPEAVAPASENTAGKPIIVLMTDYITMNQGDAFNAYTYIQSATDDKDNAMSMVKVEGSVDTTKAGDYPVSYYVVDSDGNKSNVVVLQVVVLEKKVQTE